MKQPKKTKAKGVKRIRAVYGYKPVCNDCDQFISAGFTTQGDAREQVNGHREEFEFHRCFVERRIRESNSNLKGFSVEQYIVAAFRPYCNSCSRLKEASFTTEDIAIQKLDNHREEFEFHNCGIERKM
ncbi:hypothetical protein [uncultured Pedobacter sp.]|uniref:hypothetical protein n=1 Tax=uncultured Pedobacter sp. TaxID=246139 RepID=UPI0025FE42AA|nr:hypothetical protein [uncultured Pedobacter sp.]